MNSLETMAAMLRYRRPHRSKTERRFIQRFLNNLGDLQHDKYGNRYIRIGDAPIMYSCHTDTVHRDSGLQEIAVKGVEFKLHRKSKSNCLGADNGAGVWMMRELILAKKPGLYVFHRGEECGGLGSRFLVKNTPELVKDIKVAMAFDRRGTKSIITHQWGGRCCSNEFADSLSKELNLKHEKDQGGSFTDTAVYTDLIPECTNVSVGFSAEHSSRETLDMLYLTELREAMIKMNWENLVIKRVAGTYEPRTYGGYYGKGGYKGRGMEEAYQEYYGTGNYDYGYRYSGRKFRNNNGIWEEWSITQNKWVPEKKKESTGSVPSINRNTFEVKKDTPVGFLSDLRRKDSQKSDVSSKRESLLPDGHELDQDELPFNFGETKAAAKEKDHALMLKMVIDNPGLISQMLEEYGIDSDDVAEYLQTNNGRIPFQMYMGEATG